LFNTRQLKSTKHLFCFQTRFLSPTLSSSLKLYYTIIFYNQTPPLSGKEIWSRTQLLKTESNLFVRIQNTKNNAEMHREDWHGSDHEQSTREFLPENNVIYTL
jgi:hypothetical protein